MFSKVVFCKGVHQKLCLSFTQIGQTCGRQLWNQLCKNMGILYKWKCNYWKMLKTLWQKVKLLILSNFSFCHNVFKSRLPQQRCQYASICGKVLTGKGLTYWVVTSSSIFWVSSNEVRKSCSTNCFFSDKSSSFNISSKPWKMVHLHYSLHTIHTFI